MRDNDRRIELSGRAERVLRALPRGAQREVARGIDRLAAHGIPATALRDDAGVRIVPAGDHRLMCLERDDAIVVASIEELGETTGATVRRTALTPLLTRAGRRLSRAVADLWMDLRFALRGFRRQPTFVAVTVLTLALGIGGNTAVFGVFRNVYLGELPLRDADRLLRLRSYSLAANGEVRAYNMSPRDFLQVREHTDALEDAVGMLANSFTLTGDGEPERVAGVFVAEDMTEILGVEPVLGDGFTDAQEALGVDAGVVLIGNALWQRRFGGDPGVIGATLVLDGRPTVITGVMPPAFRFPYDAELWMPIRFAADDGRSRSLAVFAHRRPDIDLAAARQELDALAATLAEEFPDTNASIGIQAQPARDSFLDDEDDTVLALAGAVVFLLLITCVNVTNVLIARFNSRRHEIGIRAALGAGRVRQLRQFLAETTLIFAAGGAFGLLLTLWLRDSLQVLVPDALRNELGLGQIHMGPALIGFTAAVSVAAALACGGVAALRVMGSNLQQVMHEGARSSGSTRRRLMQRSLVVAEVSLALILLVGAGLMIGRFRALQGEELGFDVANLLTLRANLEGTAYDSAERRSALVRSAEQQIAAVPGVLSVGTTTVNPICCGNWGAAVEIEGREPVTDGSRLLVAHRYVSPDYFTAMDIAVERGRGFSPQDDAGAVPVVMIDRRMAEHHWPGQDPVGERIRLGSRPNAPWLTIIGIAENSMDESDYEDGWYLPFHQNAAERGTDGLHFMVRFEGSAESIVAPVRQAVWDVAPALAVYDVRLMTEVADGLLAGDRLAATVAAVFALLGAALAGFGVYGLMAFFVGQQRVEIGTRLALGAQPGDVLRMVLRQAMVMTLVGLALGIAASAALSRVMGHFVGGLGTSSVPLVAGVALLLATATTAAAWIPARRAARTDPVQAMRAGE